MKVWWHKLWHWEYWPAEIIYFPTFLIWGYFAIRFRSLSFYKYANPGIENGGLLGESKEKIYRLLPEGSYPKTVLIHFGQEHKIEKLITEHHFQFPCIVKPDIGLRGIAVQRVHSIEEILEYSKALKQNFLIQELVEYPNEIGLFYYRLPGASHGKISGITLKNFLTVEGNGRHTLEQLLSQVPRHAMQIPKLRANMDLSTILPAGVKECLVPYGNHNRGTEFLNGAAHITPKLEAYFDSLLRNVEGFYFGRLDIRYTDFDSLEKGRHYSIIELNGVASEPTHIYDPKHTFWAGQKEIFRHQRIMFEVIKDSIRTHTEGGKKMR